MWLERGLGCASWAACSQVRALESTLSSLVLTSLRWGSERRVVTLQGEARSPGRPRSPGASALSPAQEAQEALRSHSLAEKKFLLNYRS